MPIELMHVSAQKMKPGQQRTSDIADRQNMDMLFSVFCGFSARIASKSGCRRVDCAHHVLSDRGFDCLVKLTILVCRLRRSSCPAAQPGNILCLLEQQQPASLP